MKAEFIMSAAREDQFITDERKSVVFAGRSNVGKSSVINRLTGRKNLARVGSAPGKTSHVNYFSIDDKFYFIDLPGYGYAKVSHAEKQRWAALLEAFFAKPERITLGVLVVDARHTPTALDRQMADVFQSLQTPYLVLANKADKLKPSQADGTMQTIRDVLKLEEATPLLPFSSVANLGKQEALTAIYGSL